MPTYTIETTMMMFGAIAGSFLNICIYRLPRGKSFKSPPACPTCEKTLGLFDNVPIITYMILKGKCRHCGAGIPIRHPIVEFLTAILFLLLYKKCGLSFELLVNMLFVSLLIAISFIDLDFKVIPDVLSVGGIVAGLAAVYFRAPIFFFREALFGILLGGSMLYAIAFLYQLLAKKEGVGGGDVKLLAMIGSFCGLKGVLFSLFAGSFIGSAVGIPLMLLKGKDFKYAIPFGPLLSLSAVIYLFQGDRFVYVFLNIVSGR
jgi:leader peptidase (prepilin peptidase) / N-methyltransferase